MKKEETELLGVRIKVSPIVPKNEIWLVSDKEDVIKIINIGNSKLYRFILWWQKLIGRIKQWTKKN